MGTPTELGCERCAKKRSNKLLLQLMFVESALLPLKKNQRTIRPAATLSFRKEPKCSARLSNKTSQCEEKTNGHTAYVAQLVAPSECGLLNGSWLSHSIYGDDDIGLLTSMSVSLFTSQAFLHCG